MGKKKTKTKRNSELKIIFFIILVALALFIVSTYAWFSTQRNVSITNLNGTVEVAEGLEISLDAKTWSNGIVLGDGADQLSIIEDAYPNHRNISPVEMLPVSTLGSLTGTAMDSKMLDIKMLRGKINNSVELSEIQFMNETLALDHEKKNHNSSNAQYPGYFAFDIFLKNSSKDVKVADELQLNYDSAVKITDSANETTGLQNTVRVAFARYGSTSASEGNWSGVADVRIESQTEILKATGVTNQDVYITDVAIWEPNSSDHAEYIVTNNNKITWSASEHYGTYNDSEARYLFGTTTQMPTYALLGAAEGQSNKISNIYDWSGTNSKTLAKQNTLQTTTTKDEDDNTVYEIKEGVQHLKSATDGTTNFTIAPNSIVRLRVYVWLEGQDIDCINWASYGGGITVNIGLVKGATVGSHGEAE